MESPKEILAWEMEIARSEKTSSWYWKVFLIIAVLVVFALFIDNILFAIFAIATGFAIVIIGSKKPERMSVEINEKGIRMNTQLFIYKHLESFWIDEDDDEPALLFKSTKALGPSTRIPLPDIPTEEIRLHLLKHLPEEEQDESFIDLISRVVGL